MTIVLIDTGYYPHSFDVSISNNGNVFTDFGLTKMQVSEKLHNIEGMYKIEFGSPLVKKMLGY